MEYEFKVGDKVRAIINDHDMLTKGKVYSVLSVEDSVIYCINDKNEKDVFLKEKFELVVEIDDIKSDNVNSPTHYASQSIECIVAMEAMLSKEEFIGYLRGNIFKYQWRYKQKNGIEDLKKAQWYQNKLIEKEDNK